jgi:hypothetical protein
VQRFEDLCPSVLIDSGSLLYSHPSLYSTCSLFQPRPLFPSPNNERFLQGATSGHELGPKGLDTVRHTLSDRCFPVRRSDLHPSSPCPTSTPGRLFDIYSNGSLDATPKFTKFMLIFLQIISVFEYAATCISAANGWGHMSPYIPQPNKTIAFKSLFVAELLWIFATALIRISVAISLLRLARCTGESERVWKWCLCSLIGVQLLISVGWLVLLFFNCHPLRGFWEPVPKMTCWPHKFTVNYGWVANRKSCRRAYSPLHTTNKDQSRLSW